MILNKEYSPEKIVSKDPRRGAIQHVYIDGDKAIGCDGHRMVVVPVIAEPSDTPTAFVSAKLLADAKKLQKDSDSVCIDPKLGAACLTHGTERSTVALTLPPVDQNQQYPSYELVTPNFDGKRTVTLAFNPKYLLELAEAIGCVKGTAINLKFILKLDAGGNMSEFLDPIVITDNDAAKNGNAAYAVLMPVRV